MEPDAVFINLGSNGVSISHIGMERRIMKNVHIIRTITYQSLI